MDISYLSDELACYAILMGASGAAEEHISFVGKVRADPQVRRVKKA